MRDPERISVILDELRQFWMRHPDWRLGQVIVNLTEAKSTSDIFYIEDDVFLHKLQQSKDETGD